MKTWAWMLGGLIVWGVHFIGVYLISSVADVVAKADDPVWRIGGLAFSLACAATTGALLCVAARRISGHDARFPDQVAALGAAVSLIAIAWQSLPMLLGH